MIPLRPYTKLSSFPRTTAQSESSTMESRSMPCAPAGSEAGAAQITVPEPVQAGERNRTCLIQSCAIHHCGTNRKQPKGFKADQFPVSWGFRALYQELEFYSCRYPEKAMGSHLPAGRALLALKTTHSPLLHKHTSLTPKQTLRDRY